MKREVPLGATPILFFALAFAATAQVRFEVPKLGYVLDHEAKALRLVTGVAGAATMESSVETGAAIERAWISPRGFALTQGKQDAGIRYLDWARNLQRDVMENAEAAAISANGRYFAVLGGGAVEIWDGDGPSRKVRFEAPHARMVAVADDGSGALVVTATGVSLWQQDRLQQIWSGEAIAGADFLPNSRDLVAYDGGRNKVLILRSGAMSELDAQTVGARAFALSGDGRKVALGGEGSIEILDTISGASSVLRTDSTVDAIFRAGGNGEVMQLRFRDDARTALLEWNGLANPQIEYLFATGGAQ